MLLYAKTLILAAMLYMSPMNIHSEDPGKRLVRMNSIAEDIVQVAYDQDEEPLFDGENGRLKTALFMASVAKNESDYSEKVDAGKRFGDHGKASCIFQIQTNLPPYHYTRDFLFSDRINCVRAGLHMIRLHRCGSWVPGMMRSYVSGSCRRRQDVKSERIISLVAFREVSGYLNVMHMLKNFQTNIVAYNGEIQY